MSGLALLKRKPPLSAVFAMSRTVSGSIEGVGTDFQRFRVNDLELVDQDSSSWNPLISWLRQIEDLQRTA